MAIVGSFDPSIEQRPPISYIGSLNDIANSSAELGIVGTALGGFSISWDTANSRDGGNRSVMVSASGTGAGWVRVPCVYGGGAGRDVSVYVYCLPGSSLVGQVMEIGTHTSSGPAPSVTNGITLVSGWTRVIGTFTAAFNYVFVGKSDIISFDGTFWLDNWYTD